ncbi:MAG: deoxyribose-phosphate aldolase [Fidelibacterota bacterium]
MKKAMENNVPDPDRNPGLPLDEPWLRHVAVNRSAVERRTATLVRRRSIKKAWQTAWYLKAISCIDLTTLAGDDTPERVLRLCRKALNPIRPDILAALGLDDFSLTTAAICVYHNFVPVAVRALAGSNLPVAAVSTGFPAGQISRDKKLDQIAASVAAGAREIDIVIHRTLVLTGQWKELYKEVALFREACGPAHMKTILSTGELATLTQVAQASLVCMMAGADFIKTSTGKEKINATLPVSLVMVRMIRDYEERTGLKVGFKPAGGISTAKDAIQWLILIKEELGSTWLTPEYFRFGASSLLGDLERQLEHQATGRYSAAWRHPLG